MPITRRAGTSGFTLLEVIIVVALLSVVAVIVGGVLSTTQSLGKQADARSEGSASVSRLMDSITRDLQTSIQVVSVTATQFNYQVPVDHDLDGDYTDTLGNVEWGAEGNLNWMYQYGWQAVSNIAEANGDIDFNEDGDLDDTYTVGNIRLVVFTDLLFPQTVTNLSGDNILQDGNVEIPSIFRMPTTETIEFNLSTPVVIDEKRNQGKIFRSRRVIAAR